MRLREWQALAAAQARAAHSGDAAGSLSWESYQRTVEANLELLQGALPGALQEAQAASANAAAAVAAAAQQAEDAAPEDGEVSAKTVRTGTLYISCSTLAIQHRAGLWLADDAMESFAPIRTPSKIRP